MMKTTMSRYILPIITLLFASSAWSQTTAPQPTPRFTPTPRPGAVQEPNTQDQKINTTTGVLRYHTTPTSMLLVTGDNPTPTPTSGSGGGGGEQACCDQAEENLGWDPNGTNEETFLASLQVQVGPDCATMLIAVSYDIANKTSNPPQGSCYQNMDGFKRNTVRHLWWQCEIVRLMQTSIFCDETFLDAKGIAADWGDAHEVGTADCSDTYVDLLNNSYARNHLAPFNNLQDCESSACSEADGSLPPPPPDGDTSSPVINSPDEDCSN